MFWRKIWYYLNPVEIFRKKEDSANANLMAMHTINRISIWVFIVCITLMVIRAYNR